MSAKNVNSGPDSARVISLLRAAVQAGRFPVGQFMPCTRDLGRKHDVSSETVRRAMKALEAEGLIVSEPRHGFRVVRRPDDKPAATLAYVLSQDVPGTWEGLSGLMLTAFQRVAGAQGFSVLGIGAEISTPQAIVEHIRQANAAGVVLDAVNPALFDAIGSLRLPTVTAEVWSPANRFDAVVQDSFGGAIQAAHYLADRGHKKIAWLGPTRESIQAIERWGGTTAGLRARGLGIPPAWVLELPDALDVDKVQALLAGPDRPTGIIALWGAMAITAAQVASRLGLRVGRDLDVVGWSTEEEYPAYEASFPEGRVPATVAWRIENLAQAVMARLTERRARPDLPIVRINAETRLIPGTPPPVPEGARP
jgi:DNA-binding LacI/PurR family transcriptional regulator